MQSARSFDAARLAGAVPWLLLAALAAALAFQDIRSLDYWWHLRTGQLIAETGAVPRVDPYTFTVPGARWIDIHWLHQLGLWGLYQAGGHAAVVLASGAAVLLLLALLAPIGYRRERALVSVGVLALMLLCIAGRLQPRPEIPTFLLLAGVLRLLHRFERTGDAWVYAIALLEVVWVNVHGLFAVGIALCGIHLAAELARPFAVPGAALRWERVRRLAAVTALAAAACLANPNGLEGALYPLQQLRMVGSAEGRGFFGHFITELQPTLSAANPVIVLLFLALAGLSGAALYLERRTVAIADVLVWAAFLYLGLGAQRNVSLFAIAVAPIAIRNWNAWLDRNPPGSGVAKAAWLGVCNVLLALAIDVASAGALTGAAHRGVGLGVARDYNPVGAAEWIARERPPGPLQHAMEDGGYVIWRLYPEYRALLDGRLEVFGAETFEKLYVTSAEQFRALDAEYRFGTVLAPYRLMPVDPLLSSWHASPEWRLVYVDDVSVVFVRAPPGEPFPYPVVDVGDPELFPPLDGSDPHRDELSLRARTRFYLAVGRGDLALATWRRALELLPGIENGAALLATLEAEQATP